MAKEVDSIHLLSCAIEASLGNDFPAFAFRLPGEDGFYWGACEPDRLMTLADGVFPERQEGFFFAPFEEGELPRYFFPVKIQRAEEISLEALNYEAGQTLANLEIKPVDSSFEPSGSFRWAAVFSTGCKIRFGFCFVGQCARCRTMDRSYARNIARL